MAQRACALRRPRSADGSPASRAHRLKVSGLDRLAHVAPLAWQHVNFYGRYRFESDLQPIDLRAIATQLAQSNTKTWGLTA